MRRSSLAEDRVSSRKQAIHQRNMLDICDIVDYEEIIFGRSFRKESQKLIENNNKRILKLHPINNRTELAHPSSWGSTLLASNDMYNINPSASYPGARAPHVRNNMTLLPPLKTNHELKEDTIKFKNEKIASTNPKINLNDGFESDNGWQFNKKLIAEFMPIYLQHFPYETKKALEKKNNATSHPEGTFAIYHGKGLSRCR